MSGPSLEERAAQRRMLNHALKVRCPDHPLAGRDRPCYDPSDEYPWGWVCLSRIAHDEDTRDGRKRYAEYLRRVARARELEARQSRKQSQIVARIAAAPTTTQEER